MPALRLFLICFLLYCSAVTVRVIGVEQTGIQADERLWASRSYQLLKNVRNDLRHWSSHLPHPGLPACIVLATAHSFSEAWNTRYNCKPTDSCYLSFSRVGRLFITLAVSLVIPITFLGLRNIVGVRSAFLASFLLALDPRFINYSRLVHIDGMLCLVFTVSALLYMHGVIKNNSWKVLGAGFFWGLAILSKPPGVLLLPALFLYRLARKFALGFRNKIKSISILDWRDVWLVLVAHITIVVLFTRLWDRQSRYTTNLGVRSPIARYVFRLGEDLQQYWPYFLLLSIGVLGFSLYCWRRQCRIKSIFYYALFNITLISIIITAFWIIFPLITRNLIFYWTWVSGLSGVKHDSYGQILSAETARGYFDILASELPDEIFIGLFLGSMVILYRLFFCKPEEKQLVQFGLLATVLVFIGFLSLSSKQGIRYVLPVMPAIYVISIIGLRAAGQILASYSRIKTHVVYSCGAVILFVIAVSRLVSFYPYYSVYFNYMSGGLAKAVEKQAGFLLTGDLPVADYLLELSFLENKPLYVAVAGDKTAIASNVNALANQRGKIKTNLHFDYYKPILADYIVSYASHPHLVPSEYKKLISNTQPVYAATFKAVNLVSIHKIPYQQLAEPYKFNLSTANRHTGKVYKDSKVVELRVEAVQHSPGYIFFMQGIRLVPGEYSLEVKGRSSMHADQLTASPRLQLELSGGCNQKHTFELLKNQSFSHVLHCKLEEPGRVLPRIFWPGGYNLYLESIQVSAAKNLR